MTNEPTLPDPGVAAYGRLSRADEKDKTTPTEEKVRLRKEILKTLARHEAQVTLSEEQITFELKSGGSLTERTGLLALLDRCRRRELHTLVLFDVDRITRDTGDWKVIESALFKGGVRLVTSRGTYHFTPNFDPSMLQILAVMGEKERRSFSFRRKATNTQRARSGQKSSGAAPYGYVWLTERKCYAVQPEHYAVVCWIFENAWKMSTRKLASELNEKGIPPPLLGKRERAADRWLPGTIGAILHNPMHTGRPAKRTEIDREGEVVHLSSEQWVWAEQDLLTAVAGEGEELVWQPLPHAISREAWDLLQETISGRRVPRQFDGPGLLNRILHCSAGAAMYRRGKGYHCDCKDSGRKHAGASISIPVVERHVVEALVQHLEALPELPTPPQRTAQTNPDTRRIQTAQVRRELREKEATRQELIMRASWYHSLPGYGVAGHTATVEALSKEIAGLKARLTTLEAQLHIPDGNQVLSMIREVRAGGGFACFFAESSPEARALAIRVLVDRIDLDPPPGGKGHNKSLRITPYAVPGLKPDPIAVEIPSPRTGRQRGPYHWKNRTVPPEQGN
jgi:DNA invertase Pin-like site-specific DNA recombinase